MLVASTTGTASEPTLIHARIRAAIILKSGPEDGDWTVAHAFVSVGFMCVLYRIHTIHKELA